MIKDSIDIRSIAQSITPAAIEWLNQTKEARVLNAFENSVNLINSKGMILSIVKPRLGRGPFAILINGHSSYELGSSRLLSNITANSKVNLTKSQLIIGQLNIDYSEAELWNPRPDWRTVNHTYLGAHLETLRRLLAHKGSAESLAVMLKEEYSQEYQRQIALAWPGLRDAFRNNNIRQLRIGTKSIAGLGPGLTPAGDDFLLGVVLSSWVSFPSGAKMPLADVMVSSSTTRTTSLSIAWLESVARGEASESWHALVRALSRPEKEPVLRSSNEIIRTGQTSGADALTGFVLGLETLGQS